MTNASTRTALIASKVEPEARDAFYTVARSLGVTPSSTVRELIIAWTEANQEVSDAIIALREGK